MSDLTGDPGKVRFKVLGAGHHSVTVRRPSGRLAF